VLAALRRGGALDGVLLEDALLSTRATALAEARASAIAEAGGATALAAADAVTKAAARATHAADEFEAAARGCLGICHGDLEVAAISNRINSSRSRDDDKE